MHYTLCLLTAAWMAGEPTNSPLGPPVRTTTTVLSQQPPAGGAGDGTQDPPVKFRDRIRNFFHLHPAENPPSPAPAPTIKLHQLPPNTVWTTHPSSQPMPSGSGKAPAASPTSLTPGFLRVQQTSSVAGSAAETPIKPVSPLRSNVELSSKDLEKVGHEQDYSWITGRLFRVQGEAGRWAIRYAGPDEVDRFGGSLMLSQVPDASRFHEGDLVCVHGKVGSTPVRIARTPAPVYEVKDITPIEQQPMR